MAIASTYPIGTSDGNEKYLGTQASDGAVRLYPKPAGGGSGTTQVLMETRTAAMAATIDVAVKSLRTAGYAAPGDGGHGLYKRLATAPATPTNKAYFRSTDRFTSSGATDATNGGYWELVPEGGEVRIEQFGAKADFNGTTGTDLYQPLLDARQFIAWESPTFGPTVLRYTYKIKLGAGRYYCSATNYMYELSNIEGVGNWVDALGEGLATQIHFPLGPISWFVYHGNNTGPGGSGLGEGGAVGGLGTSGGSRLAGISLHGRRSPSWPTDLTKTGILARTQIHLENVGIFSAPGGGVFLRGSAGAGGDMEGNVNDFSVRNLLVHSCRGDAWRTDGYDANGGYVQGLKTHTEVYGCGMRCQNSYSNYYAGLQITGYGHNGVHKDGKLYMLISAAPGIGASTTPGTNNAVWYFQGLGSVTPGYYSEWSGAATYNLGLPIFDSGGANLYDNPYVESPTVGVWAHVESPSRIEGGTLQTTHLSNHTLSTSVPAIFSKLGYGGYQSFAPGSDEYTRNGANTWTRVGGGYENAPDNKPYGLFGGLQFITHRRITDADFSAQWGYRGVDIAYGYLNCPPYWSQTTPTTTRTFGRVAPSPFKLCLRDFVLESNEDPINHARIFGVRAAQPAAAGEYAQGERYFNLTPSAAGGAGAWVVAVGGVIHNATWTSGVTYDGNTWLKTDENKFYKCQLYVGPSTVKPTHTSGTVTGADNVPWTYAGNSAPTFVTDAVIVKQPSAYTTSNVTTDRDFNANATTLDELADIVGTLIADLKSSGVLT